MEKWQRQYITEKRPTLIEQIRCNVHLLGHLSKSGVLASGEVEKLNAQGNLNGDQEKTSILLQLLPARTGAYEHLVSALYHCQQSGALLTLLYGVQINIPHQSPFQFCGIHPDTDDILSKPVNFQGQQLPLKDICKPINLVCLHNLIAQQLNVSLYKAFTDDKQQVTITTDTIPQSLPYFIPRSLSFKSQLDVDIFEQRKDDIFLIEGIELYQLSRLTRNLRHVDMDKSSNQIHHLTAGIILLEHPDHYQEIAMKTRKLVHRLKYQDGNYFYVNSNYGHGVKVIKEFLKTTKIQRISQDELVEICMKSQSRSPILLYDSPGMGKSILLAELARTVNLKDPSKSVLYFHFPEFLRKISSPGGQYDSNSLQQSILDLITTNKLGRNIMQELFNSKEYHVELFLDAFDEVHEKDLEAANALLDCISNECKNIRLYITTRPHRADELENKFGILGYNILPFNESNQASFLLKYWENQLCVAISQEVKFFAETCLKTLTSVISARERNIAGIPLLCKMLADIYGQDVKRGMIFGTDGKFRLNSIYKMYKEYIGIKLDIFKDEAEREMLYNFHVHKAVQAIFSDIDVEVLQVDLEKIYLIGIMEPSKSDSNIPSFVHRTFAEFLVAEYIANTVTENISSDLDIGQFIDLVFGSALKVQTDLEKLKEGRIQSRYFLFSHPAVTHFINCALMENAVENRSTDFKVAFRQSNYYRAVTFFSLLKASFRNNLVNLSKYLLDLFLDLDETDGTRLTFKDCLLGTNSWEAENPQKFQLLLDIRDLLGIKDLVYISAENSSIDLVKMACEFLLLVTGKEFHEFKYFISPICLAANRGQYMIFEYLLSFDKLNSDRVGILFACLIDSASNGIEIVQDKIQILKEIVQGHPEIVNATHPSRKISPLVSTKCHFELIKFLVESGADVSQTNNLKYNVAHNAATYLSADEYHKFVELMISHNYNKVFKKRNKFGATPVHLALQRIDLKTETLELFAKFCKVDFNDRLISDGSELAFAIQGERSRRVLEDIVRLGGNWKSIFSGGNFAGIDALTLSIVVGNLEAVKYFWSLGANINRRNTFYVRTPLGFALWKENVEVVKFLVENGVDVNAPFLPGSDDGETYMFPFSNRFVSPLTYAKSKESLASTAVVLKNAGAKPGTMTSCCITTGCCIACLPCCFCVTCCSE